MIAEANGAIGALQDSGPEEFCQSYVDPLSGSTTFEFREHLGADYAYGCEVGMRNPPNRRV